MNKWQKGIFHSPVIFFLLLILILSLQISIVESQPTNSNNFDPNDNNTFKPNDNNPYPNSKISPSVAIIVVLLVAALFFMGFFSIYIRQCSDDNNSGGNSVRNALAIAERHRTAASRGLEASVIETFPTFSYSEVKDHKVGKGALECAVCLNEFEDDENLRLIPKCDHVFHPECIDAWLENHVTCPVCRTNLTPEAGDEPYQLPELNQERLENNGDVAIQVDVQEVEVKLEVNRIWSFKYSNRPPRTESLKKGGRNIFGLGKFRSHSTGHLIQPSENVDRFTLRLPEDIRKEMMNRTLLIRAKSIAVHFPKDRSRRRWFRTELGGGSMKGTSSLPIIEKSDRVGRSDRWLFSKAGPFFSRKLSMKSTKVMTEIGEASASTIATTQSCKNLEPKNINEKSLLRPEPIRPLI